MNSTIKVRIIEKPAFEVIGKKTWISGQDNELFGQFWVQCEQERLFERFEQLGGNRPGQQTGSSMLGISRVEEDPTNRAFYYMIAVEAPEAGVPEAGAPAAGVPEASAEDLERYCVPASRWAVFECVGKVPEAIVKSEIYAFMEWLPASEYEHARAPEMEVYFPGNDGVSADSYCEFWLPIVRKPAFPPSVYSVGF
ncbi:MAG: GyrI-like domain-containing protein [Anaerolineae bacterium]|nr:GyrI-like domain-containing protein [Anaerolineae bacterium]